jgi:hypothetical protein
MGKRKTEEDGNESDEEYMRVCSSEFFASHVIDLLDRN